MADELAGITHTVTSGKIKPWMWGAALGLGVLAYIYYHHSTNGTVATPTATVGTDTTGTGTTNDPNALGDIPSPSGGTANPISIGPIFVTPIQVPTAVGPGHPAPKPKPKAKPKRKPRPKPKPRPKHHEQIMQSHHGHTPVHLIATPVPTTNRPHTY